MNKILFVLAVLFVSISCNKNHIPFEATNAEAYAYNIGDGTAEVNSRIYVKGFTQTEKDNNYKAAIAYQVDLIKPDNTIKKSVFSFVQNAEKGEPINDIALEAQFLLDSTYKAGTYILVYNIEDKNSENKTETKVSFDLQW